MLTPAYFLATGCGGGLAWSEPLCAELSSRVVGGFPLSSGSVLTIITATAVGGCRCVKRQGAGARWDMLGSV